MGATRGQENACMRERRDSHQSPYLDWREAPTRLSPRQPKSRLWRLDAYGENAARGAAFLARVTAGIEERAEDGARWARVDHRVEPDPRWSAAADERYRRFRAAH